MVEAGGWLLGEIGGTTGRSLKARSGVGLLEWEEGGLLRILAEEGEGIAEERLENWRLSPGCRGGHSDHSLWPLSILEMEEAEKKREELQVEEKKRNALWNYSLSLFWN